MQIWNKVAKSGVVLYVSLLSPLEGIWEVFGVEKD